MRGETLCLAVKRLSFHKNADGRRERDDQGLVMRNFLGNALLALVSILFCVVMAEGATRVIDGLPPISLDLPENTGALGVDTTVAHLDAVPLAEGIKRELFFSDPPPLPNRTKPPKEWIELDAKIPRSQAFERERELNSFKIWDMFKAWNSVLVGDPCKHSYFKSAPGKLFIYDPPDGKPRPNFRFLPNASAPDGLVTNAFGWRGRPVPFKRSPRTVRIVFVGASTTAEIHHYPFSVPEYVDNWLNRWAAERKLDIRFEVLNAGRESIGSSEIAAVVRQEVAPMRPDLVVYYEGGNQLHLATVVKDVPKGDPKPEGLMARWLRDIAPFSALARRAAALTGGSEWPKPDYKIEWPQGLDEADPDITRSDLPVNLSTILGDLDSIRAELAKVDSELAVGSFHWLAKDGLELNAIRHKPILENLNVSYFPFRYRDLERMTTFENRVFAKYTKERGIPFIDVARYMPFDPDLFVDATHNTEPGIRLRAWIVLQQLLPVIEKNLASGAWPKPVPDMGEVHPAFTVPPREITFDCRKSN